MEIDPLISQYFSDIEEYTGLSNAEELALCERIQAGDENAIGELVRANLRFVVRVSKQYVGMGLPFCDLISEGNIGLITAAWRFDATRGYRFISYAVWWVRQGILKALAEQGRTVRLPNNRVVGLTRLLQATDVLEQELGRRPGEGELADKLNLPVRDLNELAGLDGQAISLDRPWDGPDARTPSETIADTRLPEPDEEYARDEMRQVLAIALGRLGKNEAQVLTMYYGLGGRNPMTLEQIGAMLGRTRERVRQIKAKALKKLRSSDCGRLLHSYLSET